MPTTAASTFDTFDTYAGFRQAVLATLARAQHSVALFDADLAECGLESRDAIACLEQLCSTSRRADALRILLLDPAFLERECPRLTAFLVRFGHRAGVRIADADARAWTRPFLVADDAHLVTRFHRDLPRGRTDSDAASTLACFTTQFETMWSKGETRAIGARLGI